MRNSDKRELKEKYKRIGWFLLIVLVPILFFCVLLIWLKVSQWLNILIIVALLFVLFPLFSYVCQKLDDRKKKRMQNKKDPFSE